MCSVLPEKTKILATNLRNYLTCSYHLGYDLDNYFTQKQQKIMFERLLYCDTVFRQEWENGVYSIPENSAHTMFLSKYIKKQSEAKKLSRKISRPVYNEKLSKGAKNLLQAYMIKNTQEYIKEDKDRNMDTKIEEMFCGIMRQIGDRKKSYVEKKVPIPELIDEIDKYVPPSGGTKRNRCKTGPKIRKTRKQLP